MSILIYLVFFSKRTFERVEKKIDNFFKNNSNVRIDSNTIWLENMYISSHKNLININVFDKSIEWKQIVNDLLHNVLEYEEVYIADPDFGEDNGKYFEKVTVESDLESIYLKESKGRTLEN